MNPSFGTDIQEVGGVTVVSVRGEIDQATLSPLREAFDSVSERQGPVLLDLASCEFIDSSGLAAFLAFREETSSAGRGFAVCCPGSQVRKLLELTGLDRAMEVSASRDEALAALKGGLSPDPA